jgi:lysophospholipase L1-like esterase
MLSALSGANSSTMYRELEYCLNFGTPKYIIWCIGMNDGSEELLYKTYFDKINALCRERGIELILQTIPNVPTINKAAINKIIKDSGLRYIDAAAAVGADDSGNWYEGYCDDGVHPTVLGAKAIASQVLVDFPEIMQY